MSEERELISGEVYSWFGQLQHGDCWRPCWLALTSTGWLKWYSERRGHIDGVAHLPVIADKLAVEPRDQYEVNKVKAQVSQTTLDNLCPVVVVARCRVKNLEERVSFAFESRENLDKWLNAFLSVLHNSTVQWNETNLDSYPEAWQTLHEYFSSDNFPDADFSACCGVSDDKLDEIIKNDKATESRDEMIPRSLPMKQNSQSSQSSTTSAVNAGGGGGSANEASSASGTYRDMMALGWAS